MSAKLSTEWIGANDPSLSGRSRKFVSTRRVAVAFEILRQEIESGLNKGRRCNDRIARIADTPLRVRAPQRARVGGVMRLPYVDSRPEARVFLSFSSSVRAL